MADPTTETKQPETKAPEVKPPENSAAPITPVPAESVSKAAKAKEKMKAGFAMMGKVGAGAAGSAALKIKDLLKSILLFPLMLFRGDWSTRFLTMAFVISLVLFGVTGLKISTYFKGHFVKPKETVTGTNVSDFLMQQKELQIAQANILFLERFSTTIKAKSGNLTTYELELYVEADEPDTARFLRSRLDQTREVVTAALQDQVYEDLMTDAGKEALKRKILEHLNKALKKWRGNSEIKSVFFTRFIMG